MSDRTPAKRLGASLLQAERDAFLTALAEGWSVTLAAERAGKARQRFYEARAEDEEFAAAWADAWEAGTDVLEDEARRRGFEGWDEPVFQQGELVGHVRKHSDHLLTLLLRGRRPAVYREGAIVDISTTVNQLHIAPDPEQSARMLEKLQAVGLLTHVPEAQVLELTEGEGE